jgi:transposase
MGLKRRGEFRKDAVRIALTSVLTRKQVTDDPGVGMSMLSKWIISTGTQMWCQKRIWASAKRMTGFDARTVFSRRREVLKEATQFFASQKP